MYIELYVPFSDFIYTLKKIAGIDSDEDEPVFSEQGYVALYNFLCEDSSYRKGVPYHLYPGLILENFQEFDSLDLLAREVLNANVRYLEVEDRILKLGNVIPIYETDRWLFEWFDRNPEGKPRVVFLV